MSQVLKHSVVLVIALTGLMGCSPSQETAQTDSTSGAPAMDATFLATEKPENAQGVTAARGSDAEEVVVEGRVGGSAEPFVDGLAAFTIVDLAVPHCSPDEGCPTPWDYCCEVDQLKQSTALVKVVGSDGAVVSQDARQLLGIKGLSRVVVRGKTQRDEKGNLTVLAEKVHVAHE